MIKHIHHEGHEVKLKDEFSSISETNCDWGGIKGTADVMLFNIDAKADAKSERDAIVQVFLRVFNEKLLCGDAPHIAEMERYLMSKGAYETFKAGFQAQNGDSWLQERDAVDFLRDEVIAALAQSLNMTEESAVRWFDNARDDYRAGEIKLMLEALTEFADNREALQHQDLSGKRRRYRDLSRQAEREMIGYDPRRQKSPDSIRQTCFRR
jgi:hypothetical protein